MTEKLPVTVLVIDDSATNRRTLTELLEASPDVEVLERAGVELIAGLRSMCPGAECTMELLVPGSER